MSVRISRDSFSGVLLIWPIITGIPAFVVTLVLTAVLARSSTALPDASAGKMNFCLSAIDDILRHRHAESDMPMRHKILSGSPGTSQLTPRTGVTQRLRGS
jgi:hypothetical protein